MEIRNMQRLYASATVIIFTMRGDVLKVTVEYKGIPVEGMIPAYLQSKNNEKYVDTGANFSISNDANVNKQIQFNMAR